MFTTIKHYLEKQKKNVFDYLPVQFDFNMADLKFEKKMKVFQRVWKSLAIYNSLLKGGNLVKNGKGQLGMKMGDLVDLMKQYHF
jgi:hypothetical protein